VVGVGGEVLQLANTGAVNDRDETWMEDSISFRSTFYNKD
jgi:hypothetical protein